MLQRLDFSYRYLNYSISFDFNYIVIRIQEPNKNYEKSVGIRDEISIIPPLAFGIFSPDKLFYRIEKGVKSFVSIKKKF
jgi:hypothetical protein